MPELKYELKFSSRRSISIKIKADNSLIVSAPKGCSKAEINRFIQSKQAWIEKHISENNAKNGFLSDIIDYKYVLVVGNPVPFTIGGRNMFTSEEVSVKSLKDLKKLFVDNLGERFIRLLDELCAKTGLKYKSVGFKDYKSRWGCCDGSGNILFNYKLLMTPEKFWIYVAVHELCHTVYMNHSDKFYSLMSVFLPDYKSLRRQLKKYSRITELY